MKSLWVAPVFAMAVTVVNPADVLAQILSGPTFDCGRAQSGLSQVICADRATWEADWALSAAYWASYFSVEGTERTRLRDGHVAWIKTVERDCAPSAGGGACVAQRYRARAAAYRGGLTGDASTEAALKPDVLIALQGRLIALGFMAGQADGVFGASTRQAIRTYKQTLGRPPSDFLDPQERSALLRRSPAESAQRAMPSSQHNGATAYRPATPPAIDPRTALPGMILGLLGGGPNGRPFPASPPYPRRTPPGVSSPEFDEDAFERPPRSSSPGATFIRSPASSQARALDTEFSDTGVAIVGGPLAGLPRSPEGEVRTVEVKGVGDSADAARRDAARLAIQQVVGVFVDNRRRIELNVSDAKVSEVVNEKLISYTNAYVSKVDVVRTEQKDGSFEVTAKIGVAVAPLLKVLKDNAVPTVAFDTASAASTVETLSLEKAGAIELYADLIDKVDNLIKVGVAVPRVDPSLPAPPDEAWLKIPVTYSLNDDATREWRTKFDLFAQQRAEVVLKVRPERTQQGCEFPILDLGRGAFMDRRRRDFIAERPPSQQKGVAACFAAYETPDGLVAECLGRTFYSDNQDDRCVPGKPCMQFRHGASQVRLVIELLDATNSVIYATRYPFQNFPTIALTSSRRDPQNQEKGFFDYCAAPQPPFFATGTRQGGTEFGDVLVFPMKGSKVRGYLNLRLPNTVISRIGSVRAQLVKDASRKEWNE